MIARRLANLLFSSRPRMLMMPGFVATHFFDNLMFFVSLLEQQGVRYIANFGLLLGSQRLGGVLPWDEDADIFVLGETLTSLDSKLRDGLETHGFRLIPSRDGRFFWVRQACWLAAQGHIGLELLPPLITAEQTRHRRCWEKTLTFKELFPLQRYPFYSAWFWGPAASEALLARYYGESGAAAAMSRFRAPAIASAAEAFWRQARGGERLDWPAISVRFVTRRRRHPLRHILTLYWWWFNGAYNVAIKRLRRLGQAWSAGETTCA